MDENRSRFDGERAGAAPFPTKATAVFLALLLLIPMLVFTAIPNMFFGYGGSGADEITRMTQQAMALGSTYMTLENFENNLIESIIAGDADEHPEGDGEASGAGHTHEPSGLRRGRAHLGGGHL